MTLIPFYQLHHQRYSVYWDLFSEAGWEAYQTELARVEAQAREWARRFLDVVMIGHPVSEERHQFQGEQTQAGTHAGRSWRHAMNGGWFSYAIAVRPDRETRLQATFWGDDGGARTFDIAVDGKIIATQKLERNAPGRFFEVEWPLPRELTAGKDRVTVRLQARPENTAGGLFGLATLK